MHCPWEMTNPGIQPVHCSSLMVDATLKFGIPHDVHLAPQPWFMVREISTKKSDKCGNSLSHSCLLLFAIRLEPSQTPFASVETQDPFSVYFPAPQMMQLFEVPPEHVWHNGEQGVQVVPLLKLPSGQTVPVEVTDATASH